MVGRNFGCGSSREHAVWAVMQAGYRAVIAPGKGVGFADIFESNAFQNGLLVIELDDGAWQKLATAGQQNTGTCEVTIDLRRPDGHSSTKPAIATTGPADEMFHFEVPESHRHRLLNGLDTIAETLVLHEAIKRHEDQQPAWLSPQS